MSAPASTTSHAAAAAGPGATGAVVAGSGQPSAAPPAAVGSGDSRALIEQVTALRHAVLDVFESWASLSAGGPKNHNEVQRLRSVMSDKKQRVDRVVSDIAARARALPPEPSVTLLAPVPAPLAAAGAPLPAAPPTAERVVTLHQVKAIAPASGSSSSSSSAMADDKQPSDLPPFGLPLISPSAKSSSGGGSDKLSRLRALQARLNCALPSASSLAAVAAASSASSSSSSSSAVSVPPATTAWLAAITDAADRFERAQQQALRLLDDALVDLTRRHPHVSIVKITARRTLPTAFIPPPPPPPAAAVALTAQPGAVLTQLVGLQVSVAQVLRVAIAVTLVPLEPTAVPCSAANPSMCLGLRVDRINALGWRDGGKHIDASPPVPLPPAAAAAAAAGASASGSRAASGGTVIGTYSVVSADLDESSQRAGRTAHATATGFGLSESAAGNALLSVIGSGAVGGYDAADSAQSVVLDEWSHELDTELVAAGGPAAISAATGGWRAPHVRASSQAVRELSAVMTVAWHHFRTATASSCTPLDTAIATFAEPDALPPLRAFVSWIAAYQSLHSAQCVGCGRHLILSSEVNAAVGGGAKFVTPLLREYATAQPWHSLCFQTLNPQAKA